LLVLLFIVGVGALLLIIAVRRGTDVQEVEGFARSQSALEATVRRTKRINESVVTRETAG
jgi:hypothetical protein